MRYVKEEKLRNEGGSDLSAFKDHTDPAYIGPGIWYAYTKDAFNANNSDKQKAWCKRMRDLCENFPCKVCSGHCKEYIKNSPPEEYIGVIIEIQGKKRELGLFIWIWKFHNAVNLRLKKSIMSWDTAYNMYSGEKETICTKACEDAENATEYKEVKGNKPETLKPIKS